MTVICGLPNAGKTTYSKRYVKVIHYDDIPLITPKRYEYINEHIEDDICIEGVFGEKQRRIDIVNTCKGKCIKAVCIWLNTPKEECLKRENRGRPHGIVKLHSNIFEPPTLDEGWDEIIIIRGDNEQRFSEADDNTINTWQKEITLTAERI